MQKIQKNFTDTHPKIAKEWDHKKNSIKPNVVTFGTHKKVWWLCPKNHSYNSSIASRSQGRGCPYCANRLVGYGNDLKSKFPKIAKEWDFEKNKLKPNEVLYGTRLNVWWICSSGHSYQSKIINRTRPKPTGCPFCSGQKVGYGNDLKSKYPKIAKEWDHKKNNLKPNQVTFGSGKKMWWLCPKNHSYIQSITLRTNYQNQGCPYCSGKKVGYGNDLKSKYPKIAKEWDYEKNNLKPNEVFPSSFKKVWWLCSKKHSYTSLISSRTQGRGCPYCSGQKVGYGNDFKSKYPKIAKEWDYEKNSYKPNAVTPFANKKAWWICSVSHSYNSSISMRTFKNSGCPYCILTPRSKEEVYLLFELKHFFEINPEDRKIITKKIYDVDIKIPKEKIVIEYDGAYWHKDKSEIDKIKTSELKKKGWEVIRIREKPLKILSRKYNVSSSPTQYKETANKVLIKLNSLGYEILGLEKYLERKSLINKRAADDFIAHLIKEKNK